MQEIGAATRRAGGRTIAVIPRFLIARGLLLEAASETIATRDLAERKSEFRRLGGAYVALPGGVGTWEEVLEVLALRKLEQLDAPIVIANVAGYYDPLLDLVRRSVDAGFSPPELDRLFAVAADAPGVVACLAGA